MNNIQITSCTYFCVQNKKQNSNKMAVAHSELQMVFIMMFHFDV